MSSNIEDIVDNINTIQDVSEVIRDPRFLNLTSKERPKQSGGFIDPMAMVGVIGKIIMNIVVGVLVFLKGLFTELFWITPWKQSNRALFWKYIWFSIKVGFYLLVFSVAGPIFIVIGIGMVYSKMFKKMGTDGSTLIRQRLSDARDI